MNANDPDVVRIFDTTLRDGEQAPGIALTRVEKVEIAEQLARLEVDVIEAGFPVSSEGEFEASARSKVGKRATLSLICTSSRHGDKSHLALSRVFQLLPSLRLIGTSAPRICRRTRPRARQHAP